MNEQFVKPSSPARHVIMEAVLSATAEVLAKEKFTEVNEREERSE